MLTRRLADFVVGEHEFPDDVLHGAENAMIDTIGVALAGISDPACEMANQWVQSAGSRADATVWGTDLRVDASDAALANGVAAHVLDWDDTSPSLRGHPSATLVPTVLALGEATHASGAEVLAAYAVGVDVAGKLGRALGNGHYARGWHNTATVGIFACTAAAGRLWGMEAEQICRAFGLAASQSAGLLRNFGTMTKALHAGNAARGGIQAAGLARLGFTADRAIFDGENSFLQTYGGSDGAGDLGELLPGLGNPWEIKKPGIAAKAWPCCYQIHRAVVGAGDLVKEHAIRANDIEKVAIGFAPGSDAALIYDDPKTGLEAKFSAQYTLAAYLIDGDLGMTTYEDSSVDRPAVQDLMKRISRYTVPDTGTYSGTVGYTDLRIETHGGAFSTRVEQANTQPAWVVSDAEHDRKFRSCVAYAWDQAGAEELLVTLRTIRQVDDVGTLASSLARSPVTAGG